jgi:hypothetical protein
MNSVVYTRYLISNLASDCPEYKYVHIHDLLQLTCLTNEDCVVRIHETSDIKVVRHWAKVHRNRVSILTNSAKVFSAAALFFK